MTKKHFRVDVVSEDYFCGATMEFDAFSAIITDKFTLLVDGIKFTNRAAAPHAGFDNLQEGWVN